jgi:uncharacterized secreted protein with C-terminal beta-propeller domain
MQKEIKKRARIYGIAAILLATVLGAMFLLNIPGYVSSSVLKTFTSSNELRDFLTANSETQGTFLFLGPWDFNAPGSVRTFIDSNKNTAVTAEGLSDSAYSSGTQHSTTNIQVAGVDEADIVKTDGTYAYVLSNNTLFILRVYPPEEAQVLSKIAFDSNVYPIEIFVSGDRLAVLGSKYTAWNFRGVFIDVKTFVKAYDISDRTAPLPLENFTMSGSYFNSRMIGDYVYFVVSQPAYIIYDTVILPKVYTEDGIKEVAPTEIQYFDSSDNYYMFTSIVALNLQDTSEAPVRETIMMGGTSSMYVSLDNVYITFPELDGKTTIYRIRIENSTIAPEAKGTVPGHELNQFSMDEYGSYFRIATATWQNWITQSSNVYVLNMNLSIVGSLENIEPGETLDSARFIGNRCYLATSVVRRDPFFVIDVENASQPKVLGYLKIPGFTRYLHPYDENHIIGVGSENGSVKVSLFDVTNVSAPVELDRYAVPGSWSDTTVFTDHKAFLFDKSKDLLAIPVSIYGSYVGSYWQGMYVFGITLNEGLVLKGTISHQDYSADGWNSSYWVKRAFYIENVFYTVSDVKVKLSNLQDLAFIKEIELS